MELTWRWRCISEEGVDVLHSIRVINLWGKKEQTGTVLIEIRANRCVALYVCTPLRRRRPSCHVTGRVLRVRLSSLSGSGKVWIAAWARGSETPPLPPSAPASKETNEAAHIGPDSTDRKITALVARSHSPCETLLVQTPLDFGENGTGLFYKYIRYL